jgi:hypothetical protein
LIAEEIVLSKHQTFPVPFFDWLQQPIVGQVLHLQLVELWKEQEDSHRRNNFVEPVLGQEPQINLGLEQVLEVRTSHQ